MAIVRQNPNSHGSLKDLQVLINQYPGLLERKLNIQNSITWISPLESSNYAEYSDRDFISALGLEKQIKIPLGNFWPIGGPQWDALGKDDATIYLVEAKAHISELQSPGTRAEIGRASCRERV